MTCRSPRRRHWAAIFLALGGAGMIFCGVISDRFVPLPEPARLAVDVLLRRLRGACSRRR